MTDETNGEVVDEIKCGRHKITKWRNENGSTSFTLQRSYTTVDDPDDEDWEHTTMTEFPNELLELSQLLREAHRRHRVQEVDKN